MIERMAKGSCTPTAFNNAGSRKATGVTTTLVMRVTLMRDLSVRRLRGLTGNARLTYTALFDERAGARRGVHLTTRGDSDDAA